jgi:epoxyqueuosine reductase QueG
MLHTLDRHTIGQMLRTKEVDAWGVAANDPRLPAAPNRPTAISILMRLDPLVVRGLLYGPTRDYQQEYQRVNLALDDATGTLVDVLSVHGQAADRVPATCDVADDVAVFPHKTAATVAGLGWIGKTGLFVSARFGPAVRLATVFTDLELPAGEPVTQSGCGACRACVDACPAGCGRDVLWRPGMERELLFDAGACRHHMSLFTGVETMICGICIAACPLSAQH